jgi:hypothetical protein
VEAQVETDINIFQADGGEFCLTVMDADDQTYALFEELALQGGGYTWEGIVTALVQMRMPEALPACTRTVETAACWTRSRT